MSVDWTKEMDEEGGLNVDKFTPTDSGFIPEGILKLWSIDI